MSTYETKKARSEAANRAFYAFMDAYADAIGEKPAIDDPETKAARRLAAEAFGFFTAYPVTDDDRATVSAMVEAIADRARETAALAHYQTADAAARAASSLADAAEKAAHEAAAIADEAHDRAAAALINAYAEAIGDAVTEDDPEAIAAHQVARESIEDARNAWTGPDYYRIAYSDGGMDATNDGAIWYETAADLARDLRSAYESATDTHLPYAERIERPAYQRYELEAFLGEPDDYDVDAIEAEATEYDPATGRTVWTPEAVRDLWSICQRHELKA